MGLISNIQDKLSSNKDHTEEGVHSSSRTHDSTTGGLTGQGSHLQQQTGTTSSAHPTHGPTGTTATSNNPLSSNAATHGTTSTSNNPLSSNTATHGTTSSNNPLSSNSATHGTSGITGGTHPLVSGGAHNTTGYGSGEGSHLASSTGQHSNTGLTGTSHSGSGLTGASHTGSGLPGTYPTDRDVTGTSHTGSGLTGSSHTGTGLTGASHTGSGLTGSSHTGTGIGSNTHHTGTGLDSTTHRTTGSGLTGGAAHSTTGHHNTQGQHGVDFVPGSHPNANNHSAIPTAGGVKVGGEGLGNSSTHVGEHQTMGDKVKNALPGQHGNAHDAHGNPINTSTTGSHSTGSHNTTSGLAGSDHSRSNVGGISGTTGHHNTQTGSGFSSAAQPLSHDSNFNDRHSGHSGPGVGTGLAAGAAGGAGLASAGHHNTHNQTGTGLTGSNTHSTHNQTGTNTHNTTSHSGVVGEDNRGMMDKAKDALSSKRTNQPDDPITGTNYDQKNRDQYTQHSGPGVGTGLAAGAVGGAGLASAGHHNSHNQTGTGLTSGSHAHSTGHQQPGVAGITKGVDQTHIGNNTHSGIGSHSHGASNLSHEGRSAEWKDGYAAGYREATLSLGSHSSSHTNTTGTHSGSHIGSTGTHSGVGSTGAHSGSHVGSTGTHSTGTHSTAGTGYTETTKPSMMDKLNPKKDADRDGKAGIMD